VLVYDVDKKLVVFIYSPYKSRVVEEIETFNGYTVSIVRNAELPTPY